jgi:hypothetical protein
VQWAKNSLDGQEDFLLETKESSRFPSWDQNKQRRLKAWRKCKRMKTHENVFFLKGRHFQIELSFRVQES